MQVSHLSHGVVGDEIALLPVSVQHHEEGVGGGVVEGVDHAASVLVGLLVDAPVIVVRGLDAVAGEGAEDVGAEVRVERVVPVDLGARVEDRLAPLSRLHRRLRPEAALLVGVRRAESTGAELGGRGRVRLLQLVDEVGHHRALTQLGVQSDAVRRIGSHRPARWTRAALLHYRSLLVRISPL